MKNYEKRVIYIQLRNTIIKELIEFLETPNMGVSKAIKNLQKNII